MYIRVFNHLLSIQTIEMRFFFHHFHHPPLHLFIKKEGTSQPLLLYIVYFQTTGEVRS